MFVAYYTLVFVFIRNLLKATLETSIVNYHNFRNVVNNSEDLLILKVNIIN